MNRCAKCGACTTACPVFLATGKESHSPRGKQHLLEKLSPKNASDELADILSKCLLCGACIDVCARGIDTVQLISQARLDLPKPSGQNTFLRYIIRKSLGHPHALSIFAKLKSIAPKNILHRLPMESGLRLRLSLPESDDNANAPGRSVQNLPKNGGPQAETAYFMGCFSRFLNPSIALSTIDLLDQAGLGTPFIPERQTCCGLAALCGGEQNSAVTLAKKNINAFGDTDKPVLVSCASCFSHLKSYPTLLQNEPEWQKRAQSFSDRIKEISSFLIDETGFPETFRNYGIKTDKRTKVLYFDPCHLRFGKRKIMAQPRELLYSSGFEITELPNGPKCCGLGGLFHLAQPEISKSILDNLLDEIASVEPDIVTTTCSGCLIQLHAGLTSREYDIRVSHLAELI